MVKFACLYNHAFLEFFQLEASPVEGQSLQQKDKKNEKNERGKKQIKSNEKSKEVGHFPVHLKILISAQVQAKMLEKGVLMERNAFLSKLELIWPISRL